MRKYLDIPFWFTSGGLAPRTLIILLVLAVGIFVLATVVHFILKKNKYDKPTRKVGARIIEMCGWMGTILLFLIFFYYEGAYIVSYKFWFILWFGSFVTWAVLIYRDTTRLKEHKEQMSKQKSLDKYLAPAKKRKRKR